MCFLNVKEETVNVKLAKSDEIQGFQIENKETKTAEYIPQVYRGRFGRKHRFHRVRYFQLFVVITTVPTEEW